MTWPASAQWRADVVLRDGGTVRVRALGLDDADALQRFHIGQSAESTYQRFFAPRPRLSPNDLQHLLGVDQNNRVALGVTEIRAGSEEILAVGRFDRYDSDAAELACTVADSDHGRGIASLLLRHLADIGRELGVSRFTAEVLATNTAMIGFLRHTGYTMESRRDDDVLHVEIHLDDVSGPVH